MTFGEKLDFLMNITKTNNSALSLSIKLDASYISRLRRGQRGALKDPACIRAMACYFARHCQEDYQRKALSDALDMGHCSFDADKFSERLVQWLLKNQQDSDSPSKTVGGFLDDLSNIESQKSISSFTISQEASNNISTQYSVFLDPREKDSAPSLF